MQIKNQRQQHGAAAGDGRAGESIARRRRRRSRADGGKVEPRNRVSQDSHDTSLFPCVIRSAATYFCLIG